MASWHGNFFKKMEWFWINTREFAFRNRSIFEIAFIFIYAFEQAGLVWLTFNAQSVEELKFVVSIFAIIVLTTFALHKLVMESRIKMLESKVKDSSKEKFELEAKARRIIKKYQELVNLSREYISKALNNPKTNVRIRGAKKNDK